MCSKTAKIAKTNPENSQHAEWLIKSTLKRIQLVDTNILFTISSSKSGRKVLIIYNIGEDSLEKLPFLTNTNTNNSYGRIDDIAVYFLDNSSLNIPVLGLSANVQNAYYNADIKAFDNGFKTMYPFITPFSDPDDGSPISIPRYVDIMTKMIPWSTKTFGKPKTFRLIYSAGSGFESTVTEDKVILFEPGE